MLKKILISSTLVAASAMIANAATVLTTIDFSTNGGTTTAGNYTGTAAIPAIKVSTTGSVLSGNASLVFTSGSQIRHENGLFANGVAISNYNQNATSAWTFGLKTSYTVASSFILESISLNSVTLEGGDGNNYRSAMANGAGTYTIIVSNGTDTFAWESVTQSYANTGTSSVTTEILATEATKLTLTAGQTLSVTYNFAKTQNFAAGGFISVQDLTLMGSAVPEPSMFGLLAGLGALALVGSRRRRK